MLVLSIHSVARTRCLCLFHIGYHSGCFVCHGQDGVIGLLVPWALICCGFFPRNEVLRRLVLICYLGCTFVLLIGPTGFGCAMTISCVKGAVLVDWVQGFCCVRKEGRAKGPCLHCFVGGDVNSGSGEVCLSGGHLMNFVMHEPSRSLNQSLNNTPHRTLFDPRSSARLGHHTGPSVRPFLRSQGGGKSWIR
jgi:hypothetical protein